MDRTDLKTIVLLLSAATAVYLLMSAALELTRAEGAAKVAVARADIAAWELGRLQEEARDITRAAAAHAQLEPGERM